MNRSKALYRKFRGLAMGMRQCHHATTMKQCLFNATMLLLVVNAFSCLVPVSTLAKAQNPGSLVSYRLERVAISVGGPVLADVSLKNSTSQPMDVNLGGNGNENIAISITEPDGQQIERSPADQRNKITFPGDVHLEPGESYKETVVLNEWFNFDQIGVYTIEMGLKSDSQPRIVLHLQVTDRDAAEMESVCSELLSRITQHLSVQDSIAAARALGYINDPIVVSPWATLLNNPGYVDLAISGLSRIGNADAARALISKLNIPDVQARSRIRFALQAIANETTDEGLKQNIRDALSAQKQ
jgi:hypothetical protein